MRQTLVFLFAAVMIAGLVFVAYLVRSVMDDLDALSTARYDNISWNMSQLEIETLNLNRAADDAIQKDGADLSTFRRRYDIYFSRVQTLMQSAFFEQIQEQLEIITGLEATNAFLDQTTPIIDGPDIDLRAALPSIQAQIEDLHPKVRALTLAGIQAFASEDAARRAAFSQTLVKLAASVVGLIVLLLLGLATLLKLHRKSLDAAHDSQVVRSRFEAAISSSLDAVLVVDIHGKVVEFNGAAETVFGYTRQEALGGDMAELIVPEHMRDMHRNGMARFLETGEQKVIGAGRIRLEGLRKSGAIFPVELSISMSEASGERVFVSYLRDITHELEAEEELRFARDKAQASEKAKSNLLTVMSHEMRTPLNGILGSLALLEQTDVDPRQKRYLNSISTSGELLLSHVNDVLDLSSLGTEIIPRVKVEFDLQEMLQQVTDSLLANAQERGNSLTVTSLSESLGSVLGSKRSLQQCLINLVGNAIKFTSDGSVAVEVERLNDGDLVEIRVSDTGFGIAPENLDRIFEEFVTIDTSFARKNAGTGLGLAITKRLVEAMEGEIEADSVPGEGSMFTLRVPLPALRAQASTSSKDTQQKSPDILSGQHALVVDDNEINRMILREMLRDIGLTVEEAEDGFVAIRRVSETPFDIVFLDISMPGIDGIETLHRIRQLHVQWSNLPAIAVTAHAARKDHEAIKKATFSDILVKPVRPTDIDARVSPILTETTDQTDHLPVDARGHDFKAQFGEDKYQAALKELDSASQSLADELQAFHELTDEIRQNAHKLSGTAAVLGETELHSTLQTIENSTDANWAFLKAETIRFLKQRGQS
jgi:PAS domain S-box-containing protein